MVRVHTEPHWEVMAVIRHHIQDSEAWAIPCMEDTARCTAWVGWAAWEECMADLV